MPVAEECGLIVPIGQWVLREACTQLRGWLDVGLRPVSMAVNVSAVEFRSQDFLDGVRTILRETGLEPCLLEFELTETVLMNHAESTVSTMQALKELGVRLAVDDFGTGYSSLSYLRRFPIDALKLDPSFVREITNPRDATIISAVISMGKRLKQRVIAEGVETREQRNFLQLQGCDEAQGYLFSHPVVAEQCAKLLKTGIAEAVVSRRPAAAVATGPALEEKLGHAVEDVDARGGVADAVAAAGVDLNFGVFLGVAQISRPARRCWRSARCRRRWRGRSADCPAVRRRS